MRKRGGIARVGFGGRGVGATTAQSVRLAELVGYTDDFQHFQARLLDDQLQPTTEIVTVYAVNKRPWSDDIRQCLPRLRPGEGAQSIIDIEPQYRDFGGGPETVWVFRATMIGVCNAARSSYTVEPQPLDFGTVPVGVPVTAAITVVNTGLEVLNITATPPTAPFSIAAGGSLTLAPDEAGQVMIRYLPPDPQPHQASCVISDGQVATPVLLLGVGGQGVISVSPNPLDFGIVAPGTITQLSAIVRNIGTAPIFVQVALDSGDPSVWLPPQPWSATLDPSASAVAAFELHAPAQSVGAIAGVARFTAADAEPVDLLLQAEVPAASVRVTPVNVQARVAPEYPAPNVVWTVHNDGAAAIGVIVEKLPYPGWLYPVAATLSPASANVPAGDTVQVTLDWQIDGPPPDLGSVRNLGTRVRFTFSDGQTIDRIATLTLHGDDTDPIGEDDDIPTVPT